MLLLVVGGLFVVALTICIVAGSDAGNLSKEFPWQFRLAARLRTPVLVFVVVPLSFLNWCHHTIRNKFRTVHSDEAAHQQRVQTIQAQLQEWKRRGGKERLRTARPNWASMSTKLGSNKQGCYLVDTSCLNHILDVDEDRMVVRAEPGVNMGDLTQVLLPRKLALLTQVEMESITLGGVSMGFGMETHSHVTGFFQESVVEYEILTPNGELLTVNAKSDPKLFYALPWSCGTLGFLMSVTVRLTKVKDFVRMTYIPTRSAKELKDKMVELSTSPNAPYFLEATAYSKDTAVIQCGEFSDAPKDRSKINSVNYFWKPLYFRWVETFIAKGKGEEYIPLKHYYHRFTRSIFWEIEDMIPFANHPVYRVLWGWMGPPEISLLKLFQGPVIRKASVYAHVVQESIMPVRRLEEGLGLFHNWYGVYPLLLFPLRVYDRGENSGFLNPRGKNLEKGKDWGIWVDLGAYGAPRAAKEGKVWDAKTNVRAMEHWTRDIGGFQAYYTDLFCTRKEFRQMFDHSLLDTCRERFGIGSVLPEVYDKMRPERGLIDLSKEEAEEAREEAKAKAKA